MTMNSFPGCSARALLALQTAAFVLVLAIPAVGLAKKAPLRKQVARCAAIDGDLKRLDCYDRFARGAGLAPSTKKGSMKGTGKWRVNIDTNPIDDSRTVRLNLTSEGRKAGMFRSSPTLILRCKSGDAEAYIAWDDYLGSEAIVTTRFGKEEATESKWGMSTDSKATFVPDAPDFLRRLLAVDRFIAQVTPYNESPVMAIFLLKGLRVAIKPLDEVCGLGLLAVPEAAVVGGGVAEEPG